MYMYNVGHKKMVWPFGQPLELYVHVQYVHVHVHCILLKSVDSNCFALLELLSTAQRTEAQLFAMKYVSVNLQQSIFIKSCKPRQECSKCSKTSERRTRRAARVRAKVRVLNLTTLLTAREHIVY